MREPLAKGPPEIVSLKRHSADVLSCVTCMVDALEPYLPSTPAGMRTSVRLAAIYHDLGKVASGMQRVLECGGRWGYRHELLSTAIVLAAGLADESPLAAAAILTHHKSMDDLVDPVGVNADEDEEEDFVRLWRRRSAELCEHWAWVREFVRGSDHVNGGQMAARLPETPRGLPDVRDFFLGLERDLRSNADGALQPNMVPYVIARGLLMAADHLASSGITAPVVDLKRPRMRLWKFQRDLARHRGSAILEAPTGSGKTRAAIAWALANRKTGERIFYVLPYQASINAMAGTLSGEKGFGFGDEAVGVIHHSALLREFKRFFDQEADNYAEAAELARARVDQTRQFYRPIKVITPFQILKLLFGTKRFEIGLSEMLGGLVIFDEIHAYEPHVAALIEVALSRLQVLGVRYLFMTATFPEFLRCRLADAIPRLGQFGITGRNDREKAVMSRARHRLKLHDSALEDMIPEIISAAKLGTVLVVCNRIAQAKHVFDVVKNSEPRTELLHGGFTIRDRYLKESRLFKREGDWRPACRILVATQVVEVSLNVSFSTLFTEVAPVNELLQRFGRVNRFYELKRATGVHVAVRFDEKGIERIYAPERLRRTLETAPEGELLTPAVESEWVRAAYAGGYLEGEQKEYEDARESFQHVVDNLRPLYTSEDERDFYDLFDSVSVVPAELVEEYVTAHAEGRYLQAAELLMSLPMGTFWRLQREGAVERVNLPGDRASYVLAVKRHYDPNAGLTDVPVSLPVALVE